MRKLTHVTAAALAVAGISPGVYAAEFDYNDTHVSWVTNLTAAVGVRLKNPNCALVGDYTGSCGSSANTAQYANGDDGNLNYRKGDLFTAYAGVVSEVLVTAPQQGLKFLVRGDAKYDLGADNTQRTDLGGSARRQTVYPVNLLDAWVQKDFEVGSGRKAYVRAGSQVMNWGESVFSGGGINTINSLDIQKLLTPGTQLKQALLPAPMISTNAALGSGLSTELYYQFRWNKNKYPAVGSYFSVADFFGKGAQPYSLSLQNPNVAGTDASIIARRTGVTLGQANAGLMAGDYEEAPYYSIGIPYSEENPKKSGQYGVRLNWTPTGSPLNLSFYYLNYTDKSPVLKSLSDGTGRFVYLENRKLYGVSANFPVGDWAVAMEASYRPKDAVSLSPCYGAGGPTDGAANGVVGVDCKSWIDRKKYQFNVNGLLSLNPSNAPFLNSLGADSAFLTLEATFVRYPGVSPQQQYASNAGGVPVYQVVDAAYATWLQSGTDGYPIQKAVGTANSYGVTVDFNWTYDGSLIKGWQVTPGATISAALHGYTPTFGANYLQGAKSANFYVLLTQNPATWNAGINYTKYFGGNAVSQPYSDRDFVGAFLTNNF